LSTLLRRTVLASMLILLLLAAWLWTPDRDRALLETRYLRAPTDMVTVGGTPLHVRDDGPANGPPVLLIHGFGGSLHTWEPWVAPLVADGHRVLRLDLPGHGLSGPDATGDYTDARSLALITALLDARGIARADVIGHSIGGRIAWTLAARQPARVARLVLVDPDGFASPGFAYGQAPQVPTAFKLMQWVLPRPVLKMSLAPAFANPAALTDDLVTRYTDLTLGPGQRGAMLARMAQTVLVDPVPLLRSITAPTLLLWGAQDAMIPPANAQDYLKTLPDARLVTLPNVGHVPQEEAPEAALVPVRAFLARP
jgi:pimeloyl-ACP methyl ester carboxylesterase